MIISILGGTGDMGKGFALRLSRKNDVIVCSRNVDNAIKSSKEYNQILDDKNIYHRYIMGLENDEGIKVAHIVIMTIPFNPGLPELCKKFNNQIVVVPIVPMTIIKDEFIYDPLLYYNSVAELINANSNETVKVVSAFQNIPANKFCNIELIEDYDVIVCGDDLSSKKKIMDIINQMEGFRALDGGKLYNSLLIESLTPFLINLAKRNNLKDLTLKYQ